LAYLIFVAVEIAKTTLTYFILDFKTLFINTQHVYKKRKLLL